MQVCIVFMVEPNSWSGIHTFYGVYKNVGLAKSSILKELIDDNSFTSIENIERYMNYVYKFVMYDVIEFGEGNDLLS